MTALWHHFQAGGWAMWPIVIWLVLSLLIIAERSLYLFTSHQHTQVLTASVQQCIEGNHNFEKAITICKAAQTPLSRILLEGFLRVSEGPEAFQAGMDGAALTEMPKIGKRIGYLALYANLAMLCGLFGTILGLIKAFGAVGGESVDPSQKARILAEGISEAMNCTAFGLLTAIVALVGYAFLQNWAQEIENDIHRETVHVYNVTWKALRKFR